MISLITTNTADERWNGPPADLLSEVIDVVGNAARVSGIILHGSWASAKNDLSSDIDLVVIQRAGPTVEETSLIAGVQVDLYSGTLASLRERLNKDYPLNNNFMLNALHEGVICLDRGGWASALIADAKLRWDNGPAAMIGAEAKATQWALFRMLSSAKRLSCRSSLSKENALIAEMRTHQVIIQSVYLYYCARRRWTTSFPLLLRRLENENDTLYGLWEQYVNANSQEEHIHVASQFVESIYE